jgi:hypothetical protein
MKFHPQPLHRREGSGSGEENGHNLKLRKTMKHWLFTDPTRWKHFLLAIPIGLVFTILCVLGTASGMEFKARQWGGSWDWLDWLCTMLGGLVGQAVQIAIIIMALH